MIRCMIVEDELLASQVIESHLQKVAGFQLVGSCQNAREATALLNEQQVDLVFLDIQLPGMTGLNFLRSLADPPLVVFTTAYAEYALEGYEFNVIDYLLKPISFERFTKTITKIVDGRLFSQAPASNKEAPDHMFIKSSNKFFKVKFAEILFIEGMRDYLKIHTTEYQLVTHQTMNEMEKILADQQFIRVHKSYLVALRFVQSVQANFITVGKHSIPVGSTYKEKLMNIIVKKN
ncbi:MAG: LytTR family DNA-binding domain-containing protein [Bacteroidota bacterium]